MNLFVPLPPCQSKRINFGHVTIQVIYCHRPLREVISLALVTEMDGRATGATGNTSAGHVIPRSGWKAVNPRSRTEMKGPAQTVIVHHTALWSCVQSRDSLSQLAHIQNMHMHERGFDDIGYNFLISGDGTVYEGRGWGVVGAHAKAHNFDSVGIAFMGNFNDEMPTCASLTALHGLLHVGQLSGHFRHDFVLMGHRDVGKTECPGEHLYSALPKLKDQLKTPY